MPFAPALNSKLLRVNPDGTFAFTASKWTATFLADLQMAGIFGCEFVQSSFHLHRRAAGGYARRLRQHEDPDAKPGPPGTAKHGLRAGLLHATGLHGIAIEHPDRIASSRERLCGKQPRVTGFHSLFARDAC